MDAMSMYFGEFLGTALLLLLGNGVNMTLSLKYSYGKGGGWMCTCFGWGTAVTMAAYLVGWVSGAHLNPAVSLSLAVAGTLEWRLLPGYIVAQILGAFVGASLAYLTYKRQMDEEPDAGTKLGVFSTGPSIDDAKWNIVTEIVGTAVLMIGILAIGYGKNYMPPGIGPVVVGLLIMVIGLGLGGATGFAINPARDLGPRIAHAFLPIKGKGDSNWKYAWVPIVGPMIGGVIGTLLFQLLDRSCT